MLSVISELWQVQFTLFRLVFVAFSRPFSQGVVAFFVFFFVSFIDIK